MKTVMTLHEVYLKLKELRERRDMYARIIAEYVTEEDENGVRDFKEKYEHIQSVIDYYSDIEVEYENKYASESD